jgi:hypothetical protein
VTEQSKDDTVEEEGMTSYSYYEEAVRSTAPATIVPQKVSYGEARFRNFDIQEVFIDDKQKGEYYIRIKNATSNKMVFNAYVFLANRFKDCDVGVIDPGNILSLNYHIYIKTNNEMIKDAMMDIMEEIDSYINKKSVITNV